ncbi:hypothetical protein OGH69_08300 [Flavobacterium sp. MFBS3-15]|uniref:hypothetical protein n=1 Tax=Flavobacterium sp. MFBS3-15 TaxID=2989816 RepID=UPI0022360273|nr:hypothetical protein [Flavobacterium sp. MFBS3-15]MCW4468960.1 hypothetical protein [Flavobacterium sp. MFBS3-15]
MYNFSTIVNLGNLKSVQFNGFEALIPNHFDKELINKINAAIMSHTFEYSSIDSVYKKYFKNNEAVNTPDTDLLYEITNGIKKALNNIYKKHEEILYKEEKIVIFGAHIALKRLQISYDTCMMLINLGCFVEADCIIRMIFEQLSYCVNICDLSNAEFQEKTQSKRDKIFDSTNISKIKKIIQLLDLGRLYSNLSKKAHIDLDVIYKFFMYDHSINDTKIVFRSKDETIICATLLYIICYIHEVVLEYVFKEYINKFEFLKFENETYLSLPHENYMKVLSVYNKMYS